MKNPFNDLIFMFFIIIFLLLAVYISYFGYQKKYLPLKLSNFQYSTYKTHKNLPEGINSLTASALIDQCPAGQCVVDIATGFKRCAENKTSKLTYNINEEACTRPNFCDSEQIPFAVRSDGSAVSNECEKSPDGDIVPCRCRNTKTCADYQLSRFTVIGGNPSKTTKNNFSIVQDTFENQSLIGYSPIEIQDQGSQFCQINPGFTGILTHGCDFINSVQDRLGCQTIPSIVENEVSAELNWKLQKDVSINQRQVTLEVGEGVNEGIFLPNNGMIELSAPNPGSTSQSVATETISYFGVGKLNLDNKNNKQTVRLSNIVSVFLSEEGSISNDGIPGNLGFQRAWKGGVNSPSLTLVKNSFSFCSSPDTEANYKNMLLCTQKDNNVCKFGNFSYNFDKITGIKDNTLLTTDETFTRNFCQLTLTNNENLQRDNYLEDPEFYTLSCAIGSGCDGKNFQENAREESNSKYFPEVDIDGINGIWNIQDVGTFPYLNLDNPAKGMKVGGTPLGPKILLDNENLQPGDFWSIKAINQNLISGSKDTPSGTSIVVQDLFGLDSIVNKGDLPDDDRLVPEILIGGSCYQLVNAKYRVVDVDGTNVNQSSISISPALREGVSAFSDIRIRPPAIKTDQTYGIIIRDESGGDKTAPLAFRTLQGKAIPSFGGIGLDITIYKQFAFSGPNYVTKVTDQGVSGNFRIYTRGNGDIYRQILTATNSVSPMIPPENIYQLQFATNKGSSFNLNYYSPQAPFKIPMSMYYPVWNPVLYQQECIRCKPLLLASPELDSSGNLSNVIIQFSGKDFGSYEYNAGSKTNNKYCYVTTSEINFDNTEGVINTTQRIMLTEPNLEVNVGDYVLDSTLQMPYTIFPEGNLDKTKSYYSFFIAPQIFPSKDAVKYLSTNCLNKAGIDSNGYLNLPNPVTKNPFTINFGIDESTSENFVYKSASGTSILFPNQLGTIMYNKSSNSWKLTPTTPGDIIPKNPNNYFFGKKYQSLFEYKNSMENSQGKVYTDGFYFVPNQKVTAISQDRKTVIVDSLFPKQIQQRFSSNDKTKPEKTYVQFCRLDSPLKIDVTITGGTPVTSEEVVINSITDSRIVDLKITKTGSRFLQENLPLIKLNLENQKFL